MKRKIFIPLISLILLISLLLLIICNITLERHFLTEKEIESCKKAIVNKGDTTAYHNILYECYFHGRITESELLFYSTIMAYGYNYSQGHAQIFCSYKRAYHNNLSNMPENIAAIAIENLILASDKGRSHAQRLVEKYSIESRNDYLVIMEEILNDNISCDPNF